MKARFDRTFEYGKNLAKYLLVSAFVAGLAALLLVPKGSAAQMILMVASFAFLIATIVVMAKYCRCPYCGKRIMAGVLVVTSCPSCRRNLTTGKKVKKNR